MTARKRVGGPILAMAAAAGLLAAAPAMAQTVTVAQNTTAGSTNGSAGFYFGHSFLAGSAGQNYQSISFQYLLSTGANTGNETGNLYIFSSPFAGTPAQMSAATGSASFVGVGAASNGAFSFAPSVTLAGGRTYYAYNDTATSTTVNTVNGGGNSYAAGNYYYANSTGNWTSGGTIDLNFRVTGIAAAAAAPEPGTWLLMIGGFGAVGATLRQRRRSAAIPAAA